jgi:hypothetical protein
VQNYEGAGMFRIPYIYTNLPLMSLISKNKKQETYWWPLGMTWVLLLLFTWITNGFPEFFLIAKRFLTGDLTALKQTNTATIPVVTACVVVMIPMLILLSTILEKQVAKHSGNFHISIPQRLFAVITITMFFEELLARLVPLEWMTKIPLLGGGITFYLLYFGGNIVWSLCHLVNIQTKQNRHWSLLLRWILPPFVTGTFFTMIFTSHGFFAALATHTIYNMVLLSANSNIHFAPGRMLLSFYHLVFLGVYSWLFFGVRGHHLFDIQLALRDSGWEFIDYFLLVGVLTTAVFFLLEFLWYDLEQTHTIKEYMLNLVYTSLLAAAAYPAIQLINYLFSVNLLIVTVGIAAGITFIERSRSGSAISRLFWKSQLITVVLVIIHVAEGSMGIFLILPLLLHQLGERVIRLKHNPVIGDLIFYCIYDAVTCKISIRAAFQICYQHYRLSKELTENKGNHAK